MTCNRIWLRSCLLLFVLLLGACKNNDAGADLEQSNLRADSLSIKLNSPELKAVNKELLEDPSNAALYIKRAKVYSDLKELPDAVNDAKRAIRLDSTKADYYHLLVDVYFAQNNTRMAKDLLEIIEKKFPEDTEAMLKLAELYFIVRQYQKGIDYTNKALKIDERIAKAYYIKGSIYRESGDTARALSSLETAAEQDNKYKDAFYDIGVMYAARKNPIAFEYYDNVLRIDPTNQEALYARAKLLQDLGKTDEAIKEYESLTGAESQCETCHYNLGAIFLEIKKDNQKALKHFSKAIELNPSYAEAFFARGYTYARMGEKEKAKADYAACLKIVPNYEAAVQGLNEL